MTKISEWKALLVNSVLHEARHRGSLKAWPSYSDHSHGSAQELVEPLQWFTNLAKGSPTILDLMLFNLLESAFFSQKNLKSYNTVPSQMASTCPLSLLLSILGIR